MKKDRSEAKKVGVGDLALGFDLSICWGPGQFRPPTGETDMTDMLICEAFMQGEVAV